MAGERSTRQFPGSGVHAVNRIEHGIETRRAYGASAIVLGAFLCWYAAWTVTCNLLVLNGAHFGAFVWAPIVPTVITIIVLAWRGSAVCACYARFAPFTPSTVTDRGPAMRDWLLIGAAAAIAFGAADFGQRRTIVLPCILASIVVAVIIVRLRAGPGLSRLAPEAFAAGWRIPALILLLFVTYYFSHRPDGDDANFINLAIGAKRTVGAVFQYDTMIGDGPYSIHLPTYKLHSFEILGAVLSHVTGLAPITVFHILMPVALLPLLALAVFVILAPVNGRYWFAASLVWLAFLFVNESSIGGWGLHGIVRLYQGKGFYVSALLPLIAALTVRWFVRGERIDLIALTLAHICAIGFSANGLFGGPAASAFVAAAFIAADVRSGGRWRRAGALLPTLVWPVIVSATIVIYHLALPSEFTAPLLAINQLNFVTWYGIAGRLTLAALLLGGLGLIGSGFARPALLYIPLVMLLVLNPLGWHAISAVTGNLGFRIFWSVPAAMLVASTAIALTRLTGVRSEVVVTLAAAGLLVTSLAFNAKTASANTAISWRWPDLKVVRPDREVAERIAALTPRGCNILAPEAYAMQLSTIEDAPYPVFVRELYLVHYRFTMPAGERMLRERLRRFANGASLAGGVTPAVLAANRIWIGTLAVPEGTKAADDAAVLAQSLHLSGPMRQDHLLIWRGPCTAALRRPYHDSASGAFGDEI